jgi:hypothetical protein
MVVVWGLPSSAPAEFMTDSRFHRDWLTNERAPMMQRSDCSDSDWFTLTSSDRVTEFQQLHFSPSCKF